ncbi:hypothetical protein ACFLXT_04755, partial [Chloroflexota bacterium]
MKKLSGSVLFTTLVVLFFLIMLVAARDYGFGSWLYPVFAGVPMLGLGVFQLVRELRHSRKPVSEQVLDTDETDPAVAANMRDKRRILRYVGWIMGLYLGIWFLGFKLGVILFFVLFLHLEGGAKWWLNLILTSV